MRTLDIIGAQIVAEGKTRLRSPGTLVALLAALAGSLLWIPDPHGRVTSLSWTAAGGREEAPVYSASYVGFAASLVVTILVTWFGFYLVAGAIRRDRERHVGAILAATPLSRAQYLFGKFAGHAAYLAVVAAMALAAGIMAFLRFGSGPFSFVEFFGPSLLITLPAVVVTAAMAVFFDVTPGLRGRAGLVIWFFAFFAIAFAPMALVGGTEDQRRRLPIIDPAGLATQTWLAHQAIPNVTSMSTGLIIHDHPLSRVPWSGIKVTGRLVGARLVSLLAAFLPVLLAVALFDRFDPARGRPRASRKGKETAASPAAIGQSNREPAAPQPWTLAPIETHPGFAGALLAEVRLIWESAGWTKWPLLAAGLAAAAIPQEAIPGAVAAFLLLLVPAISEVAAREEISGTRGLVFSQPGVPAGVVVWKAASVAAFLLLLGAPAIVRASIASPAKAAGLAAGLLFVACAATGLASLTAGGKLFSALYLLLWYASVNRLPEADFAAVLSLRPAAATSIVYLLLGAACLGAAAWRERLRKA